MKKKLEYPKAGARFEELRVITGEVIKKGSENCVWCRCSCGTEELVRIASLVGGLKTRCRNHAMQVRPGDGFGDWEVLEEVERSPNGRQRRFRCRCRCGTERVVSIQALLYGGSQHCAACRAQRHGDARSDQRTPEYSCWIGMKQRCDNPKNRNYKNYGGRGIGYDSAWKSFEVFLADMGRKPSPKHSLERRDVNGGYGKKNCLWVLPTAQSNNRRNCRYITWNGKTQTMTEWARETGVPVRSIQYRLNRKWPLEKVFGGRFCHYQEGESLPKTLTDPQVSHHKKRRLVYARDGGCCQICGEPVSFALYQMGHIVDHALGGSDDLENLQLMCRPCNHHKPAHATREAFDAWRSPASQKNAEAFGRDRL